MATTRQKRHADDVARVRYTQRAAAQVFYQLEADPDSAPDTYWAFAEALAGDVARATDDELRRLRDTRAGGPWLCQVFAAEVARCIAERGPATAAQWAFLRRLLAFIAMAPPKAVGALLRCALIGKWPPRSFAVDWHIYMRRKDYDTPYDELGDRFAMTGPGAHNRYKKAAQTVEFERAEFMKKRRKLNR